MNTAIDAQNPAQRRLDAQYQPLPAQYQADRLMLRIGVLLGIAYLVFLGVWIWGTRFRPH